MCMYLSRELKSNAMRVRKVKSWPQHDDQRRQQRLKMASIDRVVCLKVKSNYTCKNEVSSILQIFRQ